MLYFYFLILYNLVDRDFWRYVVKIRSKVGFGLFAFSLLLVAFMMAMYIFFAVTHIWWPALVLTILVLSLCFVYFNTFYELLPDGIMLTCGFSAKAINYSNIISMTDETNSKISFCLAKERVEIKYLDNGETKFTYVSPPNREQFRELVNKEIDRYTQKLKESGEQVANVSKQERVKLSNARLKEEKAVSYKKDKKAEEKIDTLLVEPSKKPASRKKKEQEEKKLLTQLRKEKQKETKLAAKQEKEIIEKQQKVLMAQSKKNEKLYQENLKKQIKAKKQQSQANKLDKEQKRFAEKEGKKAEKIQEKKQAKARTQEIKVQAKEHKERVAAKKEVQQLKEKAEKAAARKEKQDKKSKK